MVKTEETLPVPDAVSLRSARHILNLYVPSVRNKVRGGALAFQQPLITFDPTLA